MKFQNHYFTEGRLEGHKVAVNIEEGFVSVINKGTSRYIRYNEALKAIVDRLELKGNAVYTGKSGKGELNNEYMEIIKAIAPDKKQINRTPKTDFMVDDKRISLKLNRGWIFAHFLDDAQACLMYVLEQDQEFKDKLEQEIVNIFTELRKMTFDNPEEYFKKTGGKSYGSYQLINEFTEKFKAIFNSDIEKFRISLVQNALTGKFKFVHGSTATASELMVVKFRTTKLTSEQALLDVNNINLNETKLYDLERDYDYLKEIAEKTKATFRIVNKYGNARFDLNSIQYDNQFIKENQEFLIEGFWNELTDLLKKGWEFAKDKVKKFINFLIDLINKGIVYFMNFLGLSVNINMENEILF